MIDGERTFQIEVFDKVLRIDAVSRSQAVYRAFRQRQDVWGGCSKYWSLLNFAKRCRVRLAQSTTLGQTA